MLKKTFLKFNKTGLVSPILLIILVSLLSTGQITRLYFSYEDFAFFYAFQFPEYAQQILYSPEIRTHLALIWLYKPQFLIFGYNPFWYYIITVVEFVVLNILIFYFVRLIYPSNQKLALYTGIISSACYLGIEAFTWNMTAGGDIIVFLIFTFLFFMSFFQYAKSQRIFFLFLSLLTWVIAVYFFQSRSFVLFAWLILFNIFILRNQFLKRKILFLSGALLLSGVMLFLGNFQVHEGRIEHLGITAPQFISLVIQNLALVIPSVCNSLV